MTETDIDVVLVDMEAQTAFCSDGITRSFHQMYDAEAIVTEDPEEAIAVVVKVENVFIIFAVANAQPTAMN